MSGHVRAGVLGYPRASEKAKDRVVACLEATRPLNAWLERYVG